MMSTDCDESHIRIVFGERVTDVATSYQWIYIYMAFFIGGNSRKLCLLELQLGLFVPVNCDMFASVRTGSQK